MTLVRSAEATRDDLTPPQLDIAPDSAPEDSEPTPGLAAHRPWWQRPGRPTWSVPARVAIFGLSAVLYSWNLAHIGIGNSYYSAAVKSGVESWKAFFFGSLDPSSFITIDKPPAAFWVMELSGRIFGFSSVSMLFPEALAGLATVMVLYHVVRRWFGEPAAVMASIALALTPVIVVIFRFNDPDAFLTLLLMLATCAYWHALESGKTGELVLSGALLGVAFLTKSLDAFLVVPALALVYLCCGPPHLARRLRQLCWAALALVVSSGWWVAVVELWPTNARPYIGGSTDNSELNLIFQYNGFSRFAGSGRTQFFEDGGQGLLRMFDSELGGQISWFLPLAIVGVVAGFCLTRGRERTDRERAGFVLWGSVFLTYFAVYDDARGIFHPYYTVVMAPAVAALAGAGTVALWRLGQRSLCWAWVLPAGIVVSVLWADTLLGRTGGYDPWLGPAVVVCGTAAALVLLWLLAGSSRVSWLGVTACVLAVASVFSGPFAYSLTTVGNVTTFPPTAGPGGGSPLGWGKSAGVGEQLVDYLEIHRGSAAYLVAVTGSQTAAQFIVLSGLPVIAMGGYTGWDPAPTLDAFEHLIASGKVRYVYAEDGGAAFGGLNAIAAVDEWVRDHGRVVSPSTYGATAGDWKLYDVSGSTASGSRQLPSMH
jgi:4-amino-4-deoxy-L-arabinose transferase-like glycosyltransferase